jgi:ABC-type Fe3+/spermidine/putrescine transport system ATPase subunit
MSVRLAFAVATSVTPEVLLIDEVLAVGDIGFQKKCFARIRELKKAGTTFLIVSHSTDTTWELCNKAIFLDSGKSNGVEDVKSAIAKYMNSSLSRKSSALQSEDPSQGEGGVKLSQISVQGSESSKDQIKFRDNLRIRANFETEKRIEGGYIRINISNEKYRPIATSDSSLFEGGIRDLEIGEHAMEIILNDVTLKPDRYYLDFSVCTKLGGPHLGLFKEAIHFDIQASPENHIYDFTLNALIDFPVEVLKFR